MRSHIKLFWVKCVLAVLALPTSLARASEYEDLGHYAGTQSLGNSANASGTYDNPIGMGYMSTRAGMSPID